MSTEYRIDADAADALIDAKLRDLYVEIQVRPTGAYVVIASRTEAIAVAA